MNSTPLLLSKPPKVLPSSEILGKISKKKARTQSILIIGASGSTGLACLRRFSRHREARPKLYAFCRDASKLSKCDKDLCEAVVEGDAQIEADIKRALQQTNATVVLVCIGNSSVLCQKTDIRTSSAHALVNVMKLREFRRVHALVISRAGNVGSGKKLWTRIGNNSLRAAFEDHAGQEKAFLSLKNRVTIIRPTELKDDIKATTKIQEFRDGDKPPSKQTPREDLATWVVYEVCCGLPIGGRVANITGVPSS